MTWTRETISEQHARVVDKREFERKRRERMQEREHRARLLRFPTSNVSNVVPIRRAPARPPVPPYGDAA